MENNVNNTGLTKEEVRAVLLGALVLSAGGEVKIPHEFVKDTVRRVEGLDITCDGDEWIVRAMVVEGEEN